MIDDNVRSHLHHHSIWIPWHSRLTEIYSHAIDGAVAVRASDKVFDQRKAVTSC